VKAHLPAQAYSLYYRDIIGNISSSDTTHTSKEVRMTVFLTAYKQVVADCFRLLQQRTR
jgi:hypothetical protein